MSKKDDLLTPEERAKKYGNEIMGVGIIYLVLMVALIGLRFSLLISNPLSLSIVVLQVIMLIFMTIGGKQRNRTGVTAALAFEIFMIVTSIISLVFLQVVPRNIVGLIVMILLPSDIKGLSKAIKDIENGDNSATQTQSDNSNDNLFM